MKFLILNISLFLVLQTSSQTVYKTPYGKKYHLSTCQMVENVSASLSIQQALETGLTPCKICRPPLVDKNINLIPNTPRGVSNTVQCQGVTQKGTRCKHRTSLANGYCFQHNPDKKIN